MTEKSEKEESMSQITTEISGRIPSKKNSRMQIRVRGRVINIPSKEYKIWHEDASIQLIGTPKLISNIISIELSFYFPDNRRTDLTNKAESVFDLLVDNHILKDDNWKETGTIILNPLGVSKEKCGCTIKITTVNEQKGDERNVKSKTRRKDITKEG